MPRTILIHLNLELPEGSTATADDVEKEIEGVLEVGLDPDNAPNLFHGALAVALVDDIGEA